MLAKSMVAVTPLWNLARIRRELNLTQSELGRRAGFDQQVISLLERGLPPSCWAQVQRLAAVLSVPPETLSAPRLRIDVTSPTNHVTVSALGEDADDGKAGEPA